MMGYACGGTDDSTACVESWAVSAFGSGAFIAGLRQWYSGAIVRFFRMIVYFCFHQQVSEIFVSPTSVDHFHVLKWPCGAGPGEKGPGAFDYLSKG